MASAATRSSDDRQPLATWRERVAAFRHIPAMLSLAIRTHEPYAFLTIAIRGCRACVPVALLWVGKLIIDAVVAAQASGGADWERIAGLVAVEFAIVVVGEGLTRGSHLVENLLRELLTDRLSTDLMAHAATLDLEQFERSEFYDHLERARRRTMIDVNLVSQMLGLMENILMLSTMSAALIIFNMWLFVLLALAAVPAFIGENHFAGLQYLLMFRQSAARRELDYVRYIGTSSENAKEVHAFGFAPWLIDRHRVLARRFFSENKRLARRRASVGFVLALFGSTAYYAAYLVVIGAAIRGDISIGTLTFLGSSFMRARGQIEASLNAVATIAEEALGLEDLFAFFKLRPKIRTGVYSCAVPRTLHTGFIFENVSFRYAGADHWALRGVNLRIEPGERVALVGGNGAGKTTLVKLLNRLYDPTEGRILLDGVDLRQYDLHSLRQAVGVVFQDYGRYDMRFAENIGIGDIAAARDYLDKIADDQGTEPPPRIRQAVDYSLATMVLARLKHGYGQMLGRRFASGVNLSGGEWQKVALARGYLRDACVVIMDEPTASLDARAEYEVFLRISELFGDRTAILISHRFSTVRMADRIIVLHDGRITEQGTHHSLLDLRGKYAELFDLQAAGYR